MNPYLKILRPKSWLKNLLVFIPLLLFGNIMNNLAVTIIAFVMLCVISSITYILNDISDMNDDIRNKKNRPLATGQMTLNSAILLAEGLVVAFFLLFMVINNPIVFYLSLGMFAIDLLYIWKLRHIPLLDIFSISTKYPLRLLVGFVIIGIYDYMLMAIIFLVALTLAIMKRKGELLSGMYRKVFKNYDEESLYFMFIFTVVLLNFLLIVYSILTFNSLIIAFLAIGEMALISKYYIDINGYNKAKSLAILKNKYILLLGLIIVILMILKLHGVWIIV